MQRASLKCMWLLATVVVCSVLVDAHTHDDGRTDGDDHTPHHRCVHDELMQLMREERGNVTLPLARTGANVVRAALADGGRGRKEEVWAPIRIKVFTPDLHPRQTGETSYCSAAGQVRSDFKNKQFVCTEDDVLTDEKRRIIEEVLVPAAVQLHRERLLVVPTEGRVYVPYLGDAWSVCRSFYIPPSHIEEGVVDADFILYISSVPTDVDTNAWALTCSNHHDGRPAVAVANMNPRYIRGDRGAIRTLAHEILHGLGFNHLSFVNYGMIGDVKGLRGRPERAPLMVTPIVSAVARIHFQCDEMVGMELESDGSGSSIGSHWKRRNAKDELMNPMGGGGKFYTALTIAAMESFPFYKGNYSNAETMSWGHNAGCTLINEKCVENGVSRYPSMFCSDSGSDRCDSSRFGVGRCYLMNYTRPLPPYYQYFRNQHFGGSPWQMEHCPVVETAGNGGCATGDERVLPGSIFSSTSRCLDAPFGIEVSPGYRMDVLCAEVKCDAGHQEYSVLFKGSNVWMPCPGGEVVYPSSVSNLFLHGSVSCPPFEEVCQTSEAGDMNTNNNACMDYDA